MEAQDRTLVNMDYRRTFFLGFCVAGGVGILNDHAWSRQPKGIGSRKTQWPALSIEGIIELPFEFLVCARMVMGERPHYPVHNTHTGTPYCLRTLSVLKFL